MSLPFKHHPLYQEELDYILSTRGIERLQGSTLLLTGGTGLLGTLLVDALMKYNTRGAGIHLVVVGRSEEKARTRIGDYFGSPFFHFLSHDVAAPFPSSLHADYVVPLASSTHPLAYSQQPIATMTVNIFGALHALALAARCGATMVYPSSVEVYGDARQQEAFTEEMTGQLSLANSRACYTEAKRAGEALCQSYKSEKGVQVAIGRLCRVFGPTVLADDSKASSQFIHSALRGEDIVLKSAGQQLFSYIYAPDAVSALLFIMLHGESGTAYNIAAEGCNVRLRDFAAACATAVGRQVVSSTPSRAEQQGYSLAQQAVLDDHRLRTLGWQAHYTFPAAIRRTLTLLTT